MQSPAQFTLTFTFTNLFLHFIISTALPVLWAVIKTNNFTRQWSSQNKSLLSCERIKPVPNWFKHTPGIWHLCFLCSSAIRVTVTSGSLLPPKMHVCFLSVSLIIHPLCTGFEQRKSFALFRGKQHMPHNLELLLNSGWMRQRLGATPSPALSEGSPRAPPAG